MFLSPLFICKLLLERNSLLKIIVYDIFVV